MSEYKYDFQKIKADHPIDRVAERLGLQLKKAGDTLRGPCPSGQGGERALVVTPSKGVFFSFAAQKGGDCLALVSFVKGISPRDAAAWIAGETAAPEKSTKGEAEGFKPLDYLQHDHDAVAALGFDPEDAQRLGVGFAPRGLMKGTVAIPIRTADGKLAGYIGVTDATLPPRWNA